MRRSLSFTADSKTDKETRFWSFGDQVHLPSHHGAVLPLASFNHISREVLSVEKSLKFYRDILGFQEIPRPGFDCDGAWLWGYGVSVHLVETSCPDKRRDVLKRRISHFTSCLPRVDHIAFVTNNTGFIQKILDSERVYYKRFDPPGTNIVQLFFFDPDGNVIEVSNCAPPIGEVRCEQKSSSPTSSQEDHPSIPGSEESDISSSVSDTPSF
mmetsp:Transcript_19856/g.28544  ORF Transcript_19856/g.28544 Transcript_19856/m.28544 type:complete len:212 (+) Transcript_19856:163-798(+)|eukprot:CAMPEP_0185028592 /NCGR_PEP_ID=MMETSP1103-20130426/14402_1 /TAXON_ID=36769 /ORGANISM="Paraphysomonas bandaiensis, Strain Caron Lab Isolate" /LENGTH=211 /DNA_ID=CAMNT_0027563055 /DNA_START=112 /DNA_END=747 /DNA_ORIENTATION=-